MHRWWLVSLLLLPLTACGQESENKQIKRTPASRALTDARTKKSVTDATPSRRPATSNSGGFHLDPAMTSDGGTRNRRKRRRRGRMIKLTLRSTPPGAEVRIDDRRIGVTPTFHELETDGRAHRFTFLLQGYAMETYRFVPITDGVVHGTLNKLVKPDKDAGPPAR